MTRFTFRVTSAFALVLMALIAVSSLVCEARAQESERPFGLFGLFNGSERLGGDRGAPPAGADRMAQMSGPDLVVRLERLESQIRQLTGAIEQLQFRNQQLEGQVRHMQEDNEYRFQELGAKGGGRATAQPWPQSPQPGPAPTTTPGRRGDAFDPTQNPNAPGAPHPLGSMTAAAQPPMGAPDGGEGIDGPGGPAPGAAPRSPAAGGTLATLPPSQTPRDEYDLAYGYVLRKDYALAEDSFRSFLKRYPDDRLVGEATYWLGESLFQRQRYRDAAEAFLNVSTKHESSAKAPDALLRLGQSLAALGEKDAACASLAEVSRKFPRASASVKQGVEREQKRARC